MTFRRRSRSFSSRVVVLAPLLVLALLRTVDAQEPGRVRPEPARTEQPTSPTADYRIGPGDLVTIGVSGVKQMHLSTRVSNSGRVRVPYLGVLKVADMTAAQAEAETARLLRERGLMTDPWVTVRIDQYRAQPVYALGEVMTPGQFVIKDEMYLIDLLTLAGGLAESATPVGYLYRRKPDGGALPEGEATADEAILIDFAVLNEGKKPELNLRLRGGDVLYIPQRRSDHYYVVGDVLKPGFFELKFEDRGILLSQALSKAGGPMKTAKMSAGILVRVGEDGTRQEIKVDFSAILHGRQPDLLVKANDIIFIPGSNAKTIAYGLLGIIPGMVATAPQTVR